MNIDEWQASGSMFLDCLSLNNILKGQATPACVTPYHCRFTKGRADFLDEGVSREAGAAGFYHGGSYKAT